MKCRWCDADTRVLSTRESDQFMFVRRRECLGPDPHRFSTAEVLMTFLSKLAGRGRRQKVLDTISRGTSRQRLALQRRQAVAEMTAAGHKQVVIAAELGVSLSCVRAHVAKLRNGAPGRIGRPPKRR